MAKTVVRKNLKQFGKDGNSNNFGQFGSVDAGSPLKTKSIDTIQALAAWLTGWQDAVVSGNKAPFLEDMNGIMFVMIYQIFYLLQEGIPEWDTTTTYFIGSRVRKPGTQEIYGSLTDDNAGNALPSQTDNTNWKFVYPVRFTDLVGSLGLGQIPDGLITAPKIDTLTAAQITGLLTNSQIQDLAMAKLTGGPLSYLLGGTGITSRIITGGTYVGNGIAGRVINHLNAQVPTAIIVVRTDSTPGQSPAIWVAFFQTHGGGCRTMAGVYSLNMIQSAGTTTFTIGNAPEVNQNGVDYTFLVIVPQA